MIERGRELHAAARHPRMRGLGAQHGVGRDLRGGLGDRDAVGRHQAGRNGGLRLGAALEQAALDQQTIDANTSGHDHGGTINNDRLLSQTAGCEARRIGGLLTVIRPDHKG